MKALQKFADGKEGMGVKEVPEPKAGPGDLLVEVGAVGICGSDLHIWRDEKEHHRTVTLASSSAKEKASAMNGRSATASAVTWRPWRGGSGPT